MALLPIVGDMFDLVVDRNQELGLTFVARFEVLKKDDQRDYYLIRLVDVRQEKDSTDADNT